MVSVCPKREAKKERGAGNKMQRAREGGIVVNLTLTHSFPNTRSRQFRSGLSRVTLNHRNKAREECKVMRNLKDTDLPKGMWAAHLRVSQSSLSAELFLLSAMCWLAQSRRINGMGRKTKDLVHAGILESSPDLVPKIGA